MAETLGARVEAAGPNEEVEENEEDLKNGGVILMRFLGTTSYSSNISALLTSILEQLKQAYEEEVEIPSDYGKLKSLFRLAVTRSAFLDR